jgi:hypothetical protein
MIDDAARFSCMHTVAWWVRERHAEPRIIKIRPTSNRQRLGTDSPHNKAVHLDWLGTSGLPWRSLCCTVSQQPTYEVCYADDANQ